MGMYRWRDNAEFLIEKAFCNLAPFLAGLTLDAKFWIAVDLADTDKIDRTFLPDTATERIAKKCSC